MQWEFTGVVTAFNDGSYRYNGGAANSEWQRICGNVELPIEEDFGPGTAGGHWDEECLRTELMTGFLDGGGDPLSTITVASLQDLGYSVDFSAASPFSSRDVNSNCCNNRRNLRQDDQTEYWEPRKLPELPEEAIMRAAEVAHGVMEQNRGLKPDKMPDGVEYVGGSLMTMFIFDSEDNIRDLTFKWEDIKDLF